MSSRNWLAGIAAMVIVLGTIETTHADSLCPQTESCTEDLCTPDVGSCGEQLACGSEDLWCGGDDWVAYDLGGVSIPSSDHAFDDFISPMANFVYFEDPRTLTEVRPIFVNQWIPDTLDPGVPAGGTAQLYALQFRVALTEQLSVIATKDGYIVEQTEGALDGLLDDGWADVSAGLKYNLLRDPDSGTLLSTGFTYEIPLGSREALQGLGDGEFNFFVTGGQRFLDGDAHLLSTVGYRLPADGEVQSTAMHWSNHFDLRLTETVYAFTEVIWWHYLESAEQGLPLQVAGADLFNLSSTDVAGNDLVTQAVGFRWKPSPNVVTGIAYEFPLTDFRDVIQDRIVVDLILRF